MALPHDTSYFAPSQLARIGLREKDVNVDTAVTSEDWLYAYIESKTQTDCNLMVFSNTQTAIRLRDVPTKVMRSITVKAMLDVQLMASVNLASYCALHKNSDKLLEGLCVHSQPLWKIIPVRTPNEIAGRFLMHSMDRVRSVARIAMHATDTFSFLDWTSAMENFGLPRSYAFVVVSDDKIPCTLTKSQCARLLHKKNAQATINNLRNVSQILTLDPHHLHVTLPSPDHVVMPVKDEDTAAVNMQDHYCIAKFEGLCCALGGHSLRRTTAPTVTTSCFVVRRCVRAWSSFAKSMKSTHRAAVQREPPRHLADVPPRKKPAGNVPDAIPPSLQF